MNKAVLAKLQKQFGYAEMQSSPNLTEVWSTFLTVMRKQYYFSIPKDKENEAKITWFYVSGNLLKVMEEKIGLYKIKDGYDLHFKNELMKILLAYLRCRDSYAITKDTFIWWIIDLGITTYIEGDAFDKQLFYEQIFDCMATMRYAILEKILPKANKDYGSQVFIVNLIYADKEGPIEDTEAIVFLVTAEEMLKEAGGKFKE
jgi:hypothetical protein|nr:MAG TPA: hypothetical protein [Caudoviricetes sp.]